MKVGIPWRKSLEINSEANADLLLDGISLSTIPMGRIPAADAGCTRIRQITGTLMP